MNSINQSENVRTKFYLVESTTGHMSVMNNSFFTLKFQVQLPAQITVGKLVVIH